MGDRVLIKLPRQVCKQAAPGRPVRLSGVIPLSVLLFSLNSCAGTDATGACISEQEAIEIAREEADFDPVGIETSLNSNGEEPVRVITLRSTAHPDPMGRVLIVTVACSNGRILELARN